MSLPHNHPSIFNTAVDDFDARACESPLRLHMPLRSHYPPELLSYVMETRAKAFNDHELANEKPNPEEPNSYNNPFVDNNPFLDHNSVEWAQDCKGSGLFCDTPPNSAVSTSSQEPEAEELPPESPTTLHRRNHIRRRRGSTSHSTDSEPAVEVEEIRRDPPASLRRRHHIRRPNRSLTKSPPVESPENTPFPQIELSIHISTQSPQEPKPPPVSAVSSSSPVSSPLAPAMQHPRLRSLFVEHFDSIEEERDPFEQQVESDMKPQLIRLQHPARRYTFEDQATMIRGRQCDVMANAREALFCNLVAPRKAFPSL